MDKTCLECNDKIVGREDKKFCSDGCRNSYNNKINKDSTNFMRNVNNKLRKNYRILGALNVEGKSKTTRAKLLSKGFDFDFFTMTQEMRINGAKTTRHKSKISFIFVSATS